jgi:predicted type IV restriction endonuclease
MTLKEHIDDIRNQLKQGAFPNEAAVSFSIVLRLLEALGWPRFTPNVIIPEYGVEGQRVDFARECQLQFSLMVKNGNFFTQLVKEDIGT